MFSLLMQFVFPLHEIFAPLLHEVEHFVVLSLGGISDIGERRFPPLCHLVADLSAGEAHS